MAMFKTILLQFFFYATVQACMAMTPPDGAYIPTTTDSWTMEPESTTTNDDGSTTTEEEDSTTAESTTVATMCGECDINEIVPLSMPPDTEYVTIEREPENGCKKTYFTCQRTDNLVCEDVEMFADNPAGLTPITDDTTASTVAVTLTCANDGTYSWENVNGITRLACTYAGCV